MTLLLLILVASFSLHGQERAWIGGYVFDGETKEPLIGAMVGVGPDAGTLTASDGRFLIRTTPGNARIIVRYTGYGDLASEVALNPGDTLLLQLFMFRKVIEMERMVVTAGRVDQRISELTVSVGILRPESILAAQVTDGQELINRAPGVEVLDGQVSIRGGSGFSYGAGSRVMVLVDGLPMLSADAGHVRWQALPFENIGQVEVIKGASSVMYGSSALNGIIHFRTAEATTKGVTRFFAGSGVYGKPRRDAWVWWNHPRTFSEASATHLKRYGNTDVSAGIFLQLDNGYRRLNEDHFGRVNLSLKHRSQSVTGLTYGVSMQGMHARKTDFVLWDDGTTGALKQQVATAQKLYGSTLAIDPVIGLRRGGKLSHDLRSRIMFSRNDFPEGGNNNSDAASLFAEYQMRAIFTPKVSLNSGLSTYSSTIRSPFYGDHAGRNHAFFTQADLAPHNRVKLVAGFRAEINALDTITDRIVPLFRAGINYRAAKATFLRGSFGQGYRYPSIAEKHASTTLGAVRIIPSPLVRPESGWNAELAVKQGLRARNLEGLVDIALFYTQNSDMIEYLFGIYPDPVTQQYGFGFRATNIENSRVYGFELGWLMQSSFRGIRYSIDGGYVFMYPILFNANTGKNTDQYLKFRRKHALTINFNSTIRRFEVNLHAVVRSRILEIDDVFLNPMTREDIMPGFYDYWMSNNNGFFLMDAAVAYPVSKRYKLSLALKNLTNTEYMGRPGDIRPQRHISLRVTGQL